MNRKSCPSPFPVKEHYCSKGFLAWEIKIIRWYTVFVTRWNFRIANKALGEVTNCIHVEGNWMKTFQTALELYELKNVTESPLMKEGHTLNNPFPINYIIHNIFFFKVAFVTKVKVLWGNNLMKTNNKKHI